MLKQIYSFPGRSVSAQVEVAVDGLNCREAGCVAYSWRTERRARSGYSRGGDRSRPASFTVMLRSLPGKEAQQVEFGAVQTFAISCIY